MNDNTEILPVTEFDLCTTNGSTQIIKALIPCLPPGDQKMLAILVRIWELYMTVKYFEHSALKASCTLGGDSFQPEIFDKIRRYCTPKNRQTIDMILKFMNMSEIINIFNMFSDDSDEPSGSNAPDIMDFINKMTSPAGMNFAGINNPGTSQNPMDLVSSMMSDEQESLYKEFLNKLNEEMK